MGFWTGSGEGQGLLLKEPDESGDCSGTQNFLTGWSPKKNKRTHKETQRHTNAHRHKDNHTHSDVIEQRERRTKHQRSHKSRREKKKKTQNCETFTSKTWIRLTVRSAELQTTTHKDSVRWNRRTADGRSVTVVSLNHSLGLRRWTRTPQSSDVLLGNWVLFWNILTEEPSLRSALDLQPLSFKFSAWISTEPGGFWRKQIFHLNF